MVILNLTQHRATPEQVSSGVIDAEGERLEQLVKLLTFESRPLSGEIMRRARMIADLASLWEAEISAPSVRVMIAGMPALMGPLEAACAERELVVCYSFSERVSEEVTMPDGSVRKNSSFVHRGFFPAEGPEQRNFAALTMERAATLARLAL